MGEFGAFEGGQRSPSETDAFKRDWQARVRNWEEKEKRDEMYTLEEFKEQARALGSWFVIGKRETAAMSDDKIASLKNVHKRRTENLKEPNRKRPAFIFASERLKGMDYLATPIRQRQEDDWWQGFWQASGERSIAEETETRRKLEKQAADAVVPWKKLAAADYEFFRWAERKDDYELQLGAA